MKSFRKIACIFIFICLAMSQGKAKPTVVKAKESPLFLDQPEPSTFLDKILIKASTQISRSGLFTYNFDLLSLYVD